MANKGTKRYSVRPTRIILIFLVAFFIFEAIFYLTINDFNAGVISNSFYIYTPILIVLTVVFAIISIKMTYYEFEGDKFIHHKMGKETAYRYKDILYVDEVWSTKHKMVLFYLNNGKSVILAFDKEGKIYDTILNKAKLMTWEEYKMRFPHAMK